MLKADLGDFLYIIIFIVLMLAGGIEKYVKAKKQQQDGNRLPPQPKPAYDDFEDEGEESAERRTPPQTLEEMVRRMMIPDEPRKPVRETEIFPDEAQSLETIPAEPVKSYYQPVVNNMIDSSEKEAFALNHSEEEKEYETFQEFKFDIRQAVIANEILNRKY